MCVCVCVCVAGYMKRDGFKIYFCVKVDAERGGDYDWPAGDYCIVKKGDCPFGQFTVVVV